MLFIGNKRSLLSSGLSLSGKIRKLFAASQPSALYDYRLFAQEYQDSAGTTPITAVEQPLGKVNDQSGRGNHLTQATSAARPLVSARVNLFVATEDTSNAAWAKSNVTTTGVDKIVESASSALHYIRQDVPVVGAVYDIMFEAKMAERAIAWASMDGSSNVKWFDLLNGTTGGTGSGSSFITPIADGWYQCKYTFTRTAGSAPCFIGCSDTTTILAYFGDITKGLFVRKMSTALTGVNYQQVINSTTYNTASFPTYAKFDGVDDSLSSTTGGGATTGFFWCGVVKFLALGTEQHIWSDLSGNNGYAVVLDGASSVVLLAAGNGTNLSFSGSSVPVVLGEATLITAWDDGNNLNIQINSSTVLPIARPVVTAGTTSFTEGKNNTLAANYFSGNIYPSIYRTGTPLTAAERAAAQAWCKSKAGL